MDVVTLEEAKAHLRVINTADDDSIRLYIRAATSYIIRYLNRHTLPIEGSPANVPDDIKSAALLIIGGMYEIREDKVTGTILVKNPSVFDLLHPHRVLLGV